VRKAAGGIAGTPAAAVADAAVAQRQTHQMSAATEAAASGADASQARLAAPELPPSTPPPGLHRQVTGGGGHSDGSNGNLEAASAAEVDGQKEAERDAAAGATKAATALHRLLRNDRACTPDLPPPAVRPPVQGSPAVESRLGSPGSPTASLPAAMLASPLVAGLLVVAGCFGKSSASKSHGRLQGGALQGGGNPLNWRPDKLVHEWKRVAFVDDRFTKAKSLDLAR